MQKTQFICNFSGEHKNRLYSLMYIISSIYRNSNPPKDVTGFQLYLSSLPSPISFPMKRFSKN